MYLIKVGWRICGFDVQYLAEHANQRWTVVNTVNDLLFAKHEQFRDWGTVKFSDGLCSVVCYI